VNETDVYWAIDTDTLRGGVGSIMTCPVSGCAGSPTTFASQQEGPYVIALDGSNVYWATFSPDAKTTTIEKCPISGCGAPTILSSALATYSTPFAVDDASVYWAPFSLHAEPGKDDSRRAGTVRDQRLCRHANTAR